MVECEVCDREFVNWHAARQHMNALGHWGCDTCSDEFWTEEDAEEHMDDYGHHGPEFECEACTEMFWTSQAARAHMDRLNHWRTHWCNSCQKGFQNENNLRMVRTGSHRILTSLYQIVLADTFCVSSTSTAKSSAVLPCPAPSAPAPSPLRPV